MGEIIDGWLHISTDSGTGTVNNISVHADEHTGRVYRTKTIKGETAAHTQATQQVKQLGKALTVAFDASSFTCSHNDSSLEVTGTSNAAKLNFSLDQLSAPFSIPSTIYIKPGGESNWSQKTLTNGTITIDGDPGASKIYAFKIILTCRPNTGVSSLMRTLTVTADDTETDQCTVSQAGASSSIALSISGDIPAKGGSSNPVTLTVTSNDEWDLSVN